MKRIVIVSTVMVALLGAAGLFWFGGYGKAFHLDFDVLDFCYHVEKVPECRQDCTVDLMAPSNLIVYVNGVGLTKASFDNLMAIRQASLMKSPEMSTMVAGRLMEEYKRTYVNKFVGQRLILDEAFRQGIVTTNEIQSHVENLLVRTARKKGKSPDRYLKSMGPSGRLMCYEWGLSYAMNKFIKLRVPPSEVVDDAFIKAVHDQVLEENRLAREKNEKLKRDLEELRGRNANFEELVSAVSNHFSAASIMGEFGSAWGEFEVSDIEEPDVRKEVFALPVGNVSRVLETEDELMIVVVDKVLPDEKDEEGNLLRSERRQLRRIRVEKEPILLEQSNFELGLDLQRQMQTRALNEYIQGLLTNGQNKVVYPYGRNLFKN